MRLIPMGTPGEVTLMRKHAEAEHRLGGIRLAIVSFNSVVYLFGDFAAATAWLAYTVIGVSLTYSVFALLPTRFRDLPVLRSGYFTTLSDSVLITAWLFATGGASSPFHVLWYVSLAAVALRFDFRRTVTTSFVYAALHVALAVSVGQLVETWMDTLVRATYIVFVGVVSGFAAKVWMEESAARIEATTRMSDARAAERRFRALLEFLPDPIVVADSERRITVVNARAEAVFGISRGELIAKDVAQLVAPASRETFARWFTTGLPVGAGDGRSLSLRGTRDAGEFPLEVFGSAIQGEDGHQVICVMRDVTDQLAAEEARMQNAERLREIQRLQEIDRFKTTFINMAAHELGTPLTPIKMQVHILRQGDLSRLEPKQRKALDVLDRNVARLLSLVQDVLDVARVQADRLGIERREVDLNRLVFEAVESFEESARAAGIRLRSNTEPNLVVPADEKRLTQVLFNLLSNAVKFSSPGGEVVVTTERRAGGAVVSVKDNGIGIDPALQDRLFRPFSQLQDPKERTRAGSGLGLYISKSIVELHGGTLSVRSDGPGRGSTFTIEIPLQASPARRSETARPTPAPVPASPRESLQRRIDELV